MTLPAAYAKANTILAGKLQGDTDDEVMVEDSDAILSDDSFK